MQGSPSTTVGFDMLSFVRMMVPARSESVKCFREALESWSVRLQTPRPTVKGKEMGLESMRGVLQEMYQGSDMACPF